MSVEFIVLAAVTAVWLIALTVAIVFQKKFFNTLIKNTGEKDLKKILEKLFKYQEDSKKAFKKIEGELKNLESDGKLHVQKVGLIRFNPFQETGGDHSFSLAVLNGENSGIILTGLHTRERTRMYIKPVEKGKAGIELSAEEKKAINTALKSK